jgi:hypothetical protein
MRPARAGREAFMATWRSGYAADCKSVHAGSIPAVASTLLLRAKWRALAGKPTLLRRLTAKSRARQRHKMAMDGIRPANRDRGRRRSICRLAGLRALQIGQALL